jgi:hypothetical protein
MNLSVGTYPIRVRDARGCLSAVQSMTLNNTCPSQSRAHLVAQQQLPVVLLAASPNPTEGELALEVNALKEMGEMRFQFYDVLGKLMSAEKRYLEKGQQRLNFDISSLPQGVYQIVVEGVYQKVNLIRIVKL